MNAYQEEIEAFKKEAASEYFKMQMREEKARKRLYGASFILMIFLPLLIVSLRNYRRFDIQYKNHLRVLKEKEEIATFGEELLKNQTFISSLTFKQNVSKVYLADLYDGKYGVTLDQVYFDEEYTHQCLGYFLVRKEKDNNRIYTSDYCKMDE